MNDTIGILLICVFYGISMAVLGYKAGYNTRTITIREHDTIEAGFVNPTHSYEDEEAICPEDVDNNV